MILIARSTAVLLLCALGALLIALTFGGPSAPFAPSALDAPHLPETVAGLPALQRYTARDGAFLAFREYAAESPRSPGAVVLAPGSSQSSLDLHALASALGRAGTHTYTLDLRGHGASGPLGDIAYIGQLSDDLLDFGRHVRLDKPATLVGFSASAGWVMGFAGSSHQGEYARYVLLAPTMSPAIRPSFYKFDGHATDRGWVNIGVPRLLALTFLNRLGLTLWNHIDAARFRIPESAKGTHTPVYSYALFTDLGAPYDYRANIRAIRQPVMVVAGADDDLLHAERYQEIFAEAGPTVRVTLLPHVDHLGLIFSPTGIDAVVRAIAD